MEKRKFPIEAAFPPEELSQHWRSWVWHQQNAVNSVSGLVRVFPNLDVELLSQIGQIGDRIRFQITPYMLSLVNVDDKLNPIPDDPIWNQFVPSWDTETESVTHDLEENWEMPDDMVTPILQHKYYNRANFRIQNHCLAYCMYCFEAKRVLDKDSTKESFNTMYFAESLRYIEDHPEVEEVVISGGEPLTLSNQKLDQVISSIRSIKSVKSLRIQTRAFVHNPFRIDDDFVRLLVRHDVTALGVHISHPVEISPAFIEALERFSRHGCRSILLPQIPLLKGINDRVDTLSALFMALYNLKLKPYYLLHAMPYTLGSPKFRTSVRRGVHLMKAIKRNFSNPAVPEYVIVHHRGKHTVPLEVEGTPEFQYLGKVIKFLNWQREWCYYEDEEDACTSQNKMYEAVTEHTK